MPALLPTESQGQRWLKYGGNVVLSVIVVIIVSALLIYLGHRWTARQDVTAGHNHSLSSSTVELIRDLPAKVKLVSLYTKVKRDEDSGRGDAATTSAAIRYREVADLLDEYQRKGKNISVEVIDPVAEPAKVNQLFDEVAKTYGNNVNYYRDALADFDKTVDVITKEVDQEAKLMKGVPTSKNQSLELTMALLRRRSISFPKTCATCKARCRPS